jgi:type IV secretory pathway VirB4 component
MRTGRRRGVGLSSKVPWVAMVGPGIVLCKDKQALLRLYTVRGLDFIGEDPETIGARMLQANQALKNLHGPWTLHAEAQRMRFQAYPERAGRFLVPRLIEADRRATLTDPDSGVWETRYFVALTWEPPQGQRRARAMFLRAADNFMAHMQVVLADMRVLEGEELLTTLKTTVSTHWHPVAAPMPRTDLARYLCDSTWSAGRYPEWDATLGRQHIRVLTLTGYPRRSSAVMMQRLEHLGVPFRWSTRWQEIAPHQQDKQIHTLQQDWLAQEKNVKQRTQESVTRKEERIINEDAIRKTEELSMARQDVGAGFYGIGHFSTTILTWAETAAAVEDQAQQIRHTLEGLGFIVRQEGDYGARTPVGNWLLQWLAPPHHTAAFLGAVPGNRRDNCRRAIQSTLAVTHLLPGLRAAWPGPERDDHLQQGPWFLAQTEHASLVRICHFVRDVGHMMLLGPTGSGKSTMLGFGMAQWLMYPHTQGTIFDVGRTARLLTLLVGGEWITLGGGQVQLQPLRDIDQPAEFRWCLEWLLGICERAKVQEKDGAVQRYLKERLDELAKCEADARTMTRLLHICEAHSNRVEPNAYKRRDVHGLAQADTEMKARHSLFRAVQNAIRPFARGGEYGGILDGVNARALDTHLVTFEQMELVKTPRLLEAVSQYCFHLTERRFDTRRPMWLVLEEAPLMAVMPAYKEQFDAWLMTIRKAGASLALVVNSLEQAAQMGLGLLTSENTPTRWYFPNVEACTPQTGKVYDLFGLTTAEKQLIATARPYRDIYYVCRERGRRLVQLPLSRFILDCIARNSDEDHALMDEMLQKYGREDFPRAWLREHGYGDVVVSTGGNAYATDDR